MKDTLDAVIDEVASSGTSEGVSFSKMNVANRYDSEWNDTVSEIQQPKSAVMKAGSRKRSTAEGAPSTSGQAGRPKRARKQTDAKWLGKDSTKKGKGKFTGTRKDKN